MNNILECDKIGAFCRHTHAELRTAKGGPLAGLTFGAKDIYDVAGYKTGFGSPDWLATHEPAPVTAPLLQQLCEAGACMVGRTQTDELTYSLNGENPHYGTPVNVNAPGRIPGGSSSGSAAAVAAGLVDFAVGSDTGGSVRAPASFCGIYGMRPTHGRLSLEGACPLAPSFDTAGWFARDAAMLERVGRVLLGDGRPASRPSRLLYAQDAFALAGAVSTRAFQPGLERLRTAYGDMQPVTVSDEGLSHWFAAFRLLQGYEAWRQHGGWVQRAKPALGPGVRERMQWASTLKADDVAPLKVLRENISRHMAGVLAGHAVLVLPTVHAIAPLRDTPPSQLDDFRGRAMSLLCIAGLARLPQLTLPWATLEDCPLGLSLMAARGNEILLLEMASRLAAS